jgi:hypothetical protein
LIFLIFLWILCLTQAAKPICIRVPTKTGRTRLILNIKPFPYLNKNNLG